MEHPCCSWAVASLQRTRATANKGSHHLESVVAGATPMAEVAAVAQATRCLAAPEVVEAATVLLEKTGWCYTATARNTTAGVEGRWLAAPSLTHPTSVAVVALGLDYQAQVAPRSLAAADQEEEQSCWCAVSSSWKAAAQYAPKERMGSAVLRRWTLEVVGAVVAAS